ncbi:hypothetical protein IWZ03DRAFT_410167 [Phyllosticta citriasiana]|uniref:Uncharacterized protein n=2 Tax=Phyllosticta citriasiana TaxID=595635 RepID=A0ABR1L170_9PEZI
MRARVQSRHDTPKKASDAAPVDSTSTTTEKRTQNKYKLIQKHWGADAAAYYESLGLQQNTLTHIASIAIRIADQTTAQTYLNEQVLLRMQKIKEGKPLIEDFKLRVSRFGVLKAEDDRGSGSEDSDEAEVCDDAEESDENGEAVTFGAHTDVQNEDSMEVDEDEEEDEEGEDWFSEHDESEEEEWCSNPERGDDNSEGSCAQLTAKLTVISENHPSGLAAFCESPTITESNQKWGKIRAVDISGGLGDIWLELQGLGEI